jgi:DNA (cytosine-5)-methyltransferase 1
MIETKKRYIDFSTSFLKKIDPSYAKHFKKSIEPFITKSGKFKITYNSYSLHKKRLSKKSNKVKAISFFSGAGGFDIGAHYAGVDSISCLDFDKDCINTLELNNFYKDTQLLYEDISNINSKDYEVILKKANPEKLILIGGPPCQPFSKAGYWITNKNRKSSMDPRNMISQYLRIVDELKPNGFVLENVESIMHPSNINAVESLENEVIKMGYSMQILKLNSADYGVPQKRKRIFFVVTKKNIESEPIKTHYQSSDLFNNENYPRVIDWIGPYNSKQYNEKNEFLHNKTYS